MFCRALRPSLNQHGAAATQTYLPFGNAPNSSDYRGGCRIAIISRQASSRSPHRVEKASETSNQLASLPAP